MAKLMFLIKSSPSPSRRESRGKLELSAEKYSRDYSRDAFPRFPTRMQCVFNARIYSIKFPVLSL